MYSISHNVAPAVPFPFFYFFKMTFRSVTLVLLLSLLVVTIEQGIHSHRSHLTAEGFGPLQPQGWQRYQKSIVDTNTESDSHLSCCSHVDNNDSRIRLTRREPVLGRLRPLFSSASSSSSSSSSAFIDRFQNSLQETVVFLQQTTAWALSSDNKNGSTRQPIKIVREDGHVEYLPIPPHSIPPSYLLQELKWYDRSLNQLDYGGEARLGQAGLPRRFVWFGKQQEQREQSEQLQQQEMVQGQQSSQLQQTTDEAVVVPADIIEEEVVQELQHEQLQEQEEQQEVEQLENMLVS